MIAYWAEPFITSQTIAGATTRNAGSQRPQRAEDGADHLPLRNTRQHQHSTRKKA